MDLREKAKLMFARLAVRKVNLQCSMNVEDGQDEKKPAEKCSTKEEGEDEDKHAKKCSTGEGGKAHEKGNKDSTRSSGESR